MESAVPDHILDDPKGPTEFFVQKVSVMSSDYEVYLGDKASKDTKWLVIDQQGSLWDKHCKFIVENYVRPKGGKIGDGVCLASANIKPLTRDRYKYYDMDWDTDYKYEDSDDSDGYSSSGSDEDLAEVKEKAKCKWKADTEAEFFSDREQKHRVAKCKIKAKGKAKKKKITKITRDEDGKEHTTEHTEHEEKIKKFFYKLWIGDSDNMIPIKLHGSVNHGDGQLKWESQQFDCKIEGFWTPKPHIMTKSEEYPAMDLLLGFIIANIFSPTDVAGHCSPNFKF